MKPNSSQLHASKHQIRSAEPGHAAFCSGRCPPSPQVLASAWPRCFPREEGLTKCTAEGLLKHFCYWFRPPGERDKGIPFLGQPPSHSWRPRMSKPWGLHPREGNQTSRVCWGSVWGPELLEFPGFSSFFFLTSHLLQKNCVNRASGEIKLCHPMALHLQPYQSFKKLPTVWQGNIGKVENHSAELKEGSSPLRPEQLSNSQMAYPNLRHPLHWTSSRSEVIALECRWDSALWK